MEGENVTSKLMTVGSMIWKNSTMKTVQQSDNLVRKTNSVRSKNHAIPPANRIILTDLCNRSVNQYGRNLRQTTNALRETMIDINFQIRSLNRLDENFEKIKIEIDKNIKKNNMSCFIRNGRPTREMVRDNADLLLREEQQTLRDLRKSVETKQWRISGLGNKMADFRKIMTMYLDRKSKVLDLVPDSTLPIKGTRNDDNNDEESLPELREINNIMRDSHDLIEQAKIMRRDGEVFLNDIEERRKKTTEKATKALQTKIQETKNLQKELKSAIERNRQLANRSVRNFHETEHSWLELKGPESAKHLATHERADRPLIRSLHKRSAGNLPEITDQVKGSDMLLRCLRETSNNIGMLKMAEIKLHEDVMDKHFGLKIDRQIAVLRNRKHLT